MLSDFRAVLLGSFVGIGSLAANSALAVTPECRTLPVSERSKASGVEEVAGPICGLIRSIPTGDRIIVGIGYDEASLIGIVVRDELSKKYKKDPRELKSARVVVVHGSISHYVLDKCALKIVGQPLGHQKYIFRQLEILSPLKKKEVDAFAGFGPELQILTQPKAPDLICRGADVDEIVPQWITVSRDQLVSGGVSSVARDVADALGRQSWQRAHPKEYAEILAKRYSAAGVVVSEAQIDWEVKVTGSRSLKEQLELFSRNIDTQEAPIDKIVRQLSEFAVQTKQLPAVPEPRDLISSAVLEFIDQSPDLKAIATKYDQ